MRLENRLEIDNCIMKLQELRDSDEIDVNYSSTYKKHVVELINKIKTRATPLKKVEVVGKKLFEANLPYTNCYYYVTEKRPEDMTDLELTHYYHKRNKEIKKIGAKYLKLKYPEYEIIAVLSYKCEVEPIIVVCPQDNQQ